MRQIRKSAAPQCLVRHQRLKHATYDNLDSDSPGCKQVLRESLCAEQRGLCAYCMGRIRASEVSMKVEHVVPRSHSGQGEKLQLDYSNLLGVCHGDGGAHCDALKANRLLSRNPSDPARDVARDVHYGDDGTISSDEPDFNRELNEVLGLNCRKLKMNRARVVSELWKLLPRGAEATRPRLEKLRREWDGSGSVGELRAYCMAVVYWIDKRLGRCP